jgi:hypothetical protein
LRACDKFFASKNPAAAAGIGGDPGGNIRWWVDTDHEDNPEGGGKTMIEDLKQTLKEQTQKVEQLRGYL